MEGTKSVNEDIKQEIETQNGKVKSCRASLYETRSIFRELFGEYPEGYKSKLGEGSIVKKFNELLEEKRSHLNREESKLNSLRDNLYEK